MATMIINLKHKEAIDSSFILNRENHLIEIYFLIITVIFKVLANYEDSSSKMTIENSISPPYYPHQPFDSHDPHYHQLPRPSSH